MTVAGGFPAGLSLCSSLDLHKDLPLLRGLFFLLLFFSITSVSPFIIFVGFVCVSYVFRFTLSVRQMRVSSVLNQCPQAIRD